MLKGEHITLRLMREADLDRFYTLWSDVSARGEFYPHNLVSESEFKTRFREHGYWSEEHGRMLVCNDAGDIIGGIWYFKSVPYFDALEIGYLMFDQAARSKGYMSEALRLFVSYLFEVKKINRLELRILPGNHASQRLAEKLAFKPEGAARGAVFDNGRYLDINVYSLLRKELVRD